MIKLRMALQVPLLLSLVLMDSCVTVPLQLTLNSKIEITEKEVDELSQKIFNALESIDLTPPPLTMVSKNQCETAYKGWLTEQFKRGVIPKGIITPFEYGKAKRATIPHITECRNINLEEEYDKANRGGVESVKRDGKKFGLGVYKKDLGTHKCIENFLNVNNERVYIDQIDLNVKENTLSIASPTFKIYTSYDELEEDELGETNAEENLTNDGIIMPLAESRAIPPKSTGTFIVDMDSDKAKRDQAVMPLLALDGTLIAVPSVFDIKPTTIMVNNRPYYILPHGKLLAFISIKLSITGTLGDASCVYDQFLEAIKKEDEPRREAYVPGKRN